MQRTNIFQMIHKGLRAALYDTAWKLQQADFTQDEEANDSLDRVRESLLLIDQHSRKIAGSILPLIESYEPSVTTSILEEHAEVGKQATALASMADHFRHHQSPLDKSFGGREITDAFIEFMVMNLRRMQKEETVLHQLVNRYFSPAEIRTIVSGVLANTRPWIQDFYAKWMIRGLNDQETMNWMKAVKKGSPGIVFQTLFSKAGQELPRNRFEKLATGLMPKIMPNTTLKIKSA